MARLPLTVGTAAVVAAYAIPLRLAAAALPVGAPWRAALRVGGVGVAAACVGAQALGLVMPRMPFFNELPEFLFHLAIVAAAAAGAASLSQVWLALLAPAVVALAPGPWRNL